MEPKIRPDVLVETAVEASYYLSPRDPGLIRDEVLAIGNELGLKPGAVGDAITESQALERARNGRILLKTNSASPYLNIAFKWTDSPRNPEVYEAIAGAIRDHLEEHGKAAVEVPRSPSIDAIGEPHAVDVELAMMQLGNYMKVTDKALLLTQMGVYHFREFAKISTMSVTMSRPGFSRILAATRHIIEQRTNMLPLRPEPPRSSAASAREVKRVFISHANADSKLVKDFVRLILIAGAGVPREQIFFSLDAEAIPAGTYYIPYIRDQLRGASVVIAFITPEFYRSAFCLCELGAAWASVPAGFIPILHGVGPDDMQAILGGMQALNAAKTEHLTLLHDRLVRDLGLPGGNTNDWMENLAEFMTRLG